MGVSVSLLPLGLCSSAYMASSLYLLYNPLLPWTKRKGNIPPVRLIAHRGGAAEGYENTEEAFRRAISRGAGMLELDVHLSRDNQVVVAHDSNLERLTRSPIAIKDTQFSALPRLQEQVTVDFLPGSTFSDRSISEEGRKLATLDQVLAAFPEAQVNIDLKDSDRELVNRVDQVVRAQEAQHRCVWGSSVSGRSTQWCHEANPNLGLFFSFPRFFKLYLLFYTGLLPFVPLKETHLELPMPSIFYDEKYRTPEGNVKLAKMPPLILYLADTLLMSPLLFRHLAARGIHTYVWVLNKESEYERAFSLGATGVMTDSPSKLAAFLDKRDQIQNKKID